MSLAPPIFALLDADSTVQSVLAGRIYPSGDAPQGTPAPYATWSVVSSVPQSLLAEAPPADQYRVQVDCWGATRASAHAAATAVRDALEPHGYLLNINLDERDPDTREYRLSMDFSIWQPR